MAKKKTTIDKMLEIAGVKDLQSFYAKYPDEEAFMAKHGKEFQMKCGGNLKKAQNGLTAIPSIGSQGYSPQGLETDKLQAWGQGQVGKAKQMKFDNFIEGFDKALPIAGELLEGLSQLKQEKQQLKKARQWNQVSDVVRQASEVQPEEIERDYVRPEDQYTTGEELYPIYGTGTNVLAKSGIHIKPENRGKFNATKKRTGKTTEELTHSKNPVTKERAIFAQNAAKWNKGEDGEELEKATFGNVLTAFDAAGGTDKLSGILTDITGENAGGTLGGTIGGTAGSLIGGPVGGMIGKLAGQGIGSLIDRNPYKIKKEQASMNRNIQTAAINDWAANRNSSFMRTGGNIRQNNMDDLEVYEGKAETLSYNPFLPDGGETVMFRGPSHAEGGMPIKYGQQGVEVEGGEPAVKMDGEDLVVFGNLPIKKEYIPLLGDEKAKGKKFKSYIADLSKEENKANKKLNKSMKGLNELKVVTPHDKLEFSSYKANVLGSNMKLKDIADKKQKAADLQKAINDYKEETGVKAKNGMKIAKDGETLSNQERDYLEELYRHAQEQGTGEAVKLFQEEFHRLAPKRAKEILAKYPVTNYGKSQGLFNTDLASNTDAIFGKRTEQYTVPSDDSSLFSELQFDEIPYLGNVPSRGPVVSGGEQEVEPINNTASKVAMLSQLLPYLRPSDAEELDPRQLAGEMYTLATDKLEPVQAQTYQPELGVPYDISLQDQLNTIEGDYRAAAKTIGYNPEAISSLNAQKYKAKQQVLGEQFRLNQAMKDKVYGENRNILNQAKLQNLGILDNQYTRQEQAKSNTKANKLAALNSISSKYLQNRLENRTLQTYENLYNYRYDDKGRAINMNAPVMFNTQGSGSAAGSPALPSDSEYLYKVDESGNYVPADIRKKAKSSQANGGILKAYKNY